MPIGLPEFVENPEPRCPVILLCDTSGSMAGAPIDALNEGLATFKSEVYQDEIAALRVRSCDRNFWAGAVDTRFCHD